MDPILTATLDYDRRTHARLKYWFSVPGGFVTGRLPLSAQDYLDHLLNQPGLPQLRIAEITPENLPDDPDLLYLVNVWVFAGDAVSQMNAAVIHLDQIAAWGLGEIVKQFK